MALGDLVCRIMGGDRQAEDEFIDRYARGVKMIVRHSCGDRSAADDLCQDVLKIALERIRAGAVREPDRLSGFVAAIARNRVIEHARRSRMRRESPADAAMEEPADAAPGPLEQLLGSERNAIVRAVLDDLGTDRDRQILLRYYLEEQDKDEICVALGLTREHFNRVLFRARERYRAEYDRRGAGPGRDKSARRST